MLTSLDLTDSVTDLTSSDSSVKTLALTDTETSREPGHSDENKMSEWTQSEIRENVSHEKAPISENIILKTKIVTEV